MTVYYRKREDPLARWAPALTYWQVFHKPQRACTASFSILWAQTGQTGLKPVDPGCVLSYPWHQYFQEIPVTERRKVREIVKQSLHGIVLCTCSFSVQTVLIQVRRILRIQNITHARVLIGLNTSRNTKSDDGSDLISVTRFYGGDKNENKIQ